MSERPLGLILAGGLGRRMGGGDKPLRRLGERTLLDHVVARLAPQCDGLLLSANGDPARFAAYRLPVVPDTIPGSAGPLAGLLAGLDHAVRHHPRMRAVLTVPGDAPFLPPDLGRRLAEEREREGAEIACASSGGRTHPVIALWTVDIREPLRAALAEGERGVGRFSARHRLTIVEWPAKPFDPFLNVNTPADLQNAVALAQERAVDKA